MQLFDHIGCKQLGNLALFGWLFRISHVNWLHCSHSVCLGLYCSSCRVLLLLQYYSCYCCYYYYYYFYNLFFFTVVKDMFMNVAINTVMSIPLAINCVLNASWCLHVGNERVDPMFYFRCHSCTKTLLPPKTNGWSLRFIPLKRKILFHPPPCLG